jgi:ring-1,2-phenylacetyl-CoA epoxidase subunit PaaD
MEIIPSKVHAQYEREQFRRNSSVPELWALLDQVKDPEIPVLSLWDIGILKDVIKEGSKVTIIITPTYSGCPAMDIINEDIQGVMDVHGIEECLVIKELSPAWTTDWMTEKGRNQLRSYGIAPPNDVVGNKEQELTEESQVLCPHCGSDDTRMISEFGSTACKSLFQCNSCAEPFDLFKHI